MKPNSTLLATWHHRCCIAAIAVACAAQCFAGTAVDEFVMAAKAAYAEDPNCTTSIVRRYSEKSGLDDRTPGMVEWVAVEGARNVRDIGGWTGLRRGMVFRGTEVGFSKRKDGSRRGYSEYTENGRKTFLETMKIKTDFDLRGKAEYGTNYPNSVIGGGVKLLEHPISSYAYIFSPKESKACGEALREFANPAIYPTYVHCMGGADRTGTLQFSLSVITTE